MQAIVEEDFLNCIIYYEKNIIKYIKLCFVDDNGGM